VTIVELVLNTEGVPEHVHVVRSVAKDMKKKDRDKAKDLDQKAVRRCNSIASFLRCIRARRSVCSSQLKCSSTSLSNRLRIPALVLFF
jgi:hypothetical protein